MMASVVGDVLARPRTAVVGRVVQRKEYTTFMGFSLYYYDHLNGEAEIPDNSGIRRQQVALRELGH